MDINFEDLPRGKNPDLDYDISRIVFCTDDIMDQSDTAETVVFAAGFLGRVGLKWKKTTSFSDSSVRQANIFYGKNDRKEFERGFGSLVDEIDRNLLLRYAREGNPELARALECGQSDLKTLLWEAYQKTFEGADSFHTSAQIFGLAERAARENVDSHSIFLLGKHKVVSPRVDDRSGKFSYHMVGRGFYGLGSCNPLRKLVGRGQYAFSVPFGLVRSRGTNVMNAYVKLCILHEWVGHTFLGLGDHFTEDRTDCIMYAYPSTEAHFRGIMDHYERGISLCGECLERVKH